MATKDEIFDEACMIVGVFCFTQAFKGGETDRVTMVYELEKMLVENLEQTGARDLAMEMAIDRLRYKDEEC